MDDKKKVKRICFMIIYIILAAVLIEVVVTFVSKKLNNYVTNKKEDKTQEEFENTYVGKNNKNVSEFVNSILLAIKSKDYDYIFSNLDSTYNEYKFGNNKDNLKTYIEQTFTPDMELNVISVDTFQGMSHVIVGINKGESFNSKIFTVSINGDSYAVMFDAYYNLLKRYFTNENGNITYDIECTSDLASYRLLYDYTLSDSSVYVFEIENISGEELNLEFENVRKVFSDGEKANSRKIEPIKIDANKTIRIEVTFPETDTYQDEIYFDCIENGTKIQLEFTFNNGIVY